MRNAGVKISIICALLLFCVSLGAEEFSITYEKLDDVFDRGFQPWSGAEINMTLEAPEGNWKLPKLNAPIPVYGFLTLGDTKMLFILDQADKENNFFNRLYLDANANNDLTDDPIIDVSSQERQRYGRKSPFLSQDITYQYEGKTLPYRFWFFFRINIPIYSTKTITPKALSEHFSLSIISRCVYKSQFTLGGQKYQMLLSDTNCNGRFDDALSLPPDYKKVYENNKIILPSGDNMYLRKDGGFTWYDEQRFAQKIFLEGRLYDISINLASGKLTLNPATDATATIKFPMEVAKLGLYHTDGGASINFYNAAGDIKIPAGKYLLTGYTSFRNDSRGDKWLLRTSATINTPITTIEENNIVLLKMGEPFMPRVDIPYWSLQEFANNQRSVRLDLVTEGAGGEEIKQIIKIPNQRMKYPNSERFNPFPKEATYTIFRLDGKIVIQGRFEYG